MVLGLNNNIISGSTLDSGYVNQYSLQLDGVGDGLLVDRTSALRCEDTNSFTMGGWVGNEYGWSTNSVNDFIITSNHGGGFGIGVYANRKVRAQVDLNDGSGGSNQDMTISTNFDSHQFGYNSGTNTGYSTGDGGYQFIVMTLDTTSGTGVFSLYVGGGGLGTTVSKSNDIHLVGTDTATSGNDTINYAYTGWGLDRDISIGYKDQGSSTPIQHMTGFIDEAFIMNTALSIGQLRTVYNNGAGIDMTKASGALAGGAAYDPGSNLVGLWRMDEGTGTTVEDSSGNNHTATLQGDPTWSTTVRQAI